MRILDLYCGAGGASVGYNRAGWEVIGVDIKPQPNYPLDFVCADAIEVLDGLWRGYDLITNKGNFSLEDFDAIHASPPCQSSSALTKGTNYGLTYPDLIPETRELLEAIGLPFVIENVAGADIRKDLRLCGEMYGLAVIRHRFFELNWDCPQPEHKKHRGRVAGWRHGVYYDGPYLAPYGDGGGKGSLAEWQAGMDVRWMKTKKEITESIPPVYTEYIGHELRWQLLDLETVVPA